MQELKCNSCNINILDSEYIFHKQNCFFANFSCISCKSIFETKEELLIHQNRKKNYYKYCKYCNQKFIKTNYLTDHLKNNICKYK